MTRKAYRAQMRAKHGADWWKSKEAKDPAPPKAKKAPPAPRFRTFEQVVEEEGLADDVQERLRGKGWSGWPIEWGWWEDSVVSKDGKTLCYHGMGEDSGYSGDSYTLCVKQVGKKYRLTLMFREGYGGGGSEDPEDDIKVDLGTHDMKKAIWLIKVGTHEKYVQRVIGDEYERRFPYIPDED